VGLEKNKKIGCVYNVPAYMQAFPVCSKTHRQEALAQLVFFAAYSNSLHIHQDMVYTSYFLIFYRPKLGGDV